MSAELIPASFASSRRTVGLSPETPLIGELDTILKSGADIKTAVETLMSASGLLKSTIGDAIRDRITGIPEVRRALERLQGAGLIVVNAGEQGIELTTLRDVAKTVGLALEAIGNHDIEVGEGVIGIAGEAALALELSVVTPAVANELGLPIASFDVLHQFQMRGSAGLKGALKVKVVSVGADAGASAGVTWYFQRHIQDTVVSSLVDAAFDLRQGACPWNLDQVMKVLDEPKSAGAHLDAMKAIDLVAERSLGFKAGVKLSRGFTRSVNVSGAQDKESVSVAATVGVGFDYALRRTGSTKIRVTRSDGDIILALTQTHKSTSARSLNVGLDIGISGFDAVAKGWIEKLLPPAPEHFVDLIKKWSTPGTLLKDRLRAALSERLSEILQPLVPLLVGGTDAEGAADVLVEKLFSAWEEALNSRISLIGQSAESVLDGLIGSVADAFGDYADSVTPVLQQEVQPIIERVEALQAELNADVAAAVEALKGQSKAIVAQALIPLGEIGEKVDQLADNINTHVEPVATAIKSLLSRYEKLRQALLDGAKRAASLKIALAFQDSMTKTKGEERLLVVRFRRASKSAQALFRDLVLGRGDIDIDAMKGAATASHGAFSIDSGSLVVFAERARSMSLTLDFFGLPFGEVRLLNSDVRVEVDPSGRVKVIGVGATHSKQSTTLNEVRTARFSAEFDLIDPQLDTFPGVFSLGFELSDDNLKPKEVEQFFSGFEDAGVLKSGGAARVRDILGSEPAKNVQLAVALMGLSNALTNALRRVSTETTERLQRQAFAECLRFMRPRSDVARIITLRADRAQLFEWVLDSRTWPKAKRTAENVLLKSRDLFNVDLVLSSRNVGALGRQFRCLNLAINAIPDAVKHIGMIGRMAEELKTGLVSDDEVRKARDQMDIELDAANMALRPIIDVGDPINGLYDERLPEITVALLAVLADLAGPDGLDAKPVLSHFTLDAKGHRSISPPIVIG